MKLKILVALMAVVLAISMGAVVLADTPTPTPTPTTTPTPAITTIEGAISAVDATAKTVTINPNAGGTAVTLTVTDTTVIETPGNDNATLADLAAGQLVEAKYQTSSLAALVIEVHKAKPGKIQGTISAIDPTAKTITVTPGTGDPVTLTITDNTRINIWGKDPATLGDLKVGDAVKATYDTATKEAIQIAVNENVPAANRQGLFGTVKSKTDTSIVVTTAKEDVTLTVDANTLYWNPPQKNATLADVTVGARIAVLAEKQTDGSLLAKRVLIIPAKPTRIQEMVTVTAISGNTVTLTDKDGNVSTIQLPAGMADKLTVGDLITITLLKTPGADKVIPGGIMSGNDLKNRLNSFVNNTKNAKGNSEKEKSARTQALGKLETMLQNNMDRQQQVMGNIKDKVQNPIAKQAIQNAMEKSKQGWEQARENLQKVKGQPTSTPAPTSTP